MNIKTKNIKKLKNINILYNIMAYMLDPDKRDTDEFVSTLNASPNELIEVRADAQIIETLTIGSGIPKYIFPPTRSLLSERVLVDPGTGILEWRSIGSLSVATFAFKKLIDTNTSYTLLLEDYIVEAESPTYNSFYLPPSTGNGGKTFVLSQGFPKSFGTIKIYPDGADTIEGDPYFELKGENDRATLYSNDEGDWYVI